MLADRRGRLLVGCDGAPLVLGDEDRPVQDVAFTLLALEADRGLFAHNPGYAEALVAAARTLSLPASPR